jgi:RecB family exonuclease
MLFTHATASRIKTFKQCQFRYFLEYMVEFPPMRGDSIYTGKGSAVHEALEGWVNAKLGVEKKEGVLVEEDYEKTLQKYYEKHKTWTLDQRTPDKNGKPRGFPHPVEKTCESCPWATKDDRCAIANQPTKSVKGCPRPNFQDDLDLTKKTLERKDYAPLELDEDGKFTKKILGAEVAFDDELGGVRVRGVIDLLVEDDEETIEIIDYKTGKSMSYAKACKDPQVRTYGAIVRKLYPQYKYVLMTLHYLRKYPVTIPLSPEDDELTILSLQQRAKQIAGTTDPWRVSPSKWGFPCDWCIGYDNCGKIQDSFKVKGRFRLPVISCSFISKSEPCWGNIHAVKDQEVDFDNVPSMLYACKGHTEVHGGGEYAPKPDDSDKADRPDGDNSEEVSGDGE